jgi:hypothetical protein
LPADLDAAFRKFIPAVRCGRATPWTSPRRAAHHVHEYGRLGLEDDRIHALILGYWHTIVTPPMVFARTWCRWSRR